MIPTEKNGARPVVFAETLHRQRGPQGVVTTWNFTQGIGIMIEERWNLCARFELCHYFFDWYMFILSIYIKCFFQSIALNRIDRRCQINSHMERVKKREKKACTNLESGCWTEYVAGGSPYVYIIYHKLLSKYTY